MKKLTLVLVLGTALLTACNQGAEEAKKKAMEDSIQAAKAAEAKQKAMEDSIARVQAEEAAKAAMEADSTAEGTTEEAAH